MDIALLFFACLKLRFPDVEVNPGPRAAGLCTCRTLCCNIRGLHGNLKDLSLAALSLAASMAGHIGVRPSSYLGACGFPLWSPYAAFAQSCSSRVSRIGCIC